MRSTLWTAIEVNERPMGDFIEAIRKAQEEKLINEESEEYSYLIQSVDAFGKGIIGTLYKYKNEKKVSSINPATGKVTTESVNNFPVADYAIFGISETEIIIEEKRPHLGQRLVLRILLDFASKEGVRNYNIDLKTDRLKVEQFMNALQLLEVVRFTKIGVNPGPIHENLKRFEELADDAGSNTIEFKNKKKGLNKRSKVIDGGIRLASENKAEVHMEGQNVDGEPQVLDTVDAKAKEREKLEYEPSERLSKITEAIRRKLRL